MSALFTWALSVAVAELAFSFNLNGMCLFFGLVRFVL
jgi:hypothetical protein